MRLLILTIIHLLLFSYQIYGTSLTYNQRFNLSNGLPNNGVTTLLEDSKGYIWIGTYDGLARYNGHSLSNYTNTISSKIFESNRIRSLFEDKNSNIWIGTDFGVTVFNYNTGKFYNLEGNSRNNSSRECIVRDIFCSRDSSLIYSLTEQNGILVYDSKSYKLVEIYSLDKEAIFQDAIDIIDKKFLLASNKGVILYDLDSKEIEQVYKSIGTPNFIGTFTRFNSSTILYGSNNGIMEINYTLNNSTPQFNIKSKINYANNAVKSMCIDKMGSLWVGSQASGLFILKDALNNWGKPLERVVGKARISSFLDTYSSSIWVGTFDDGVYRYNYGKELFTTLNISIDAQPVRTVQIFPYNRNSILYQNSFEHISLYDLRNGEELKFPFKLESSGLKHLKYMTKLNNGDIWLFMSDGVKSWRIINHKGSKKSYKVYDKEMDNYVYDFPYTITEDYLGYLWIGTPESLQRVTKNGDKIEKLETLKYNNDKGENISRIYSIFSDSTTKSVWFGTLSQGLFNFKYGNTDKLKDGEVINYQTNSLNNNSISSNFISAINRCNGKLWIGTEQGGLCSVDESGNEIKFRAYGTEDGLSSNTIKSILNDNSGDIWVTSNFGISKYSVRDDKFMIYRPEQGVPFDEFSYKSFNMGDTLLFSGLSNICYFNPNELEQELPKPSIEFTNLKIYNDIIDPSESYNGRVILSNALTNGDKIELKYDENMISIGVDALYKSNLHDSNIKYRLTPLSKQWINMPYNSNEITFSGLRHGSYTLEVSTTDFFGVNSDKKSLIVTIAPPFWLSTWAYIIYVILIIAIGATIIFFITNLQRLRYKFRIEQMNKHNMEVMNAEKMRYFSNISHEIKTPLTLIMAPISLLYERFIVDVDVRSKLDIVKRQSDKILHLIELVHGIQLNDSNLLKRNNSKYSFNEFITNIITDFKFMASYESKTFIINECNKDIIVEADSDMLEKIVNNLLSNALKYTRNEGTIEVSYSYEDNNLIITVKDSGYGIDRDDLEHVFERFFRAKQRGVANVGGTGIGLYFTKTLVELHNGEISVESELDRGTKFTVSLPIIIDKKELEQKSATITEDYKAQILGELTLDNINSNSEFKDFMVYIVEDNSEMREFIQTIVSKFFCTKVFSNGAECCEAMKSEWPDILVSDVMMPIMDGYELCETLKSDIKTSHIPIILLTACSTVDDKIKGLKYGADSYIPKPFYPNHIITRIETLLNNRKQLRERFQINIPIVYGSTSSTRAKDNDFLEKLYSIFSNNLDNEDLDLDLVINEFGINRNLFFQKVKALTNSSPRELLFNYRLKKAAEFLLSGEMNVNEACDMTGFKSRSHFSRLFKEKYGVTPSKYGK